MKQQILTTGVVLSRRDFQEADRLLTILTPDHGKVKTIAKGVRRPGSKLAGGIELFSISDMTLLPGKGDFDTLVSTRMKSHFGNIVKDINRTMLGYEFLKRIDRVTEQAAEMEYYDLLVAGLGGLNDSAIHSDLVELWFTMQLLAVSGHAPNLMTDSEGAKLVADKTYLFDFDEMSFREQTDGPFNASHIKLLRLGYGTNNPAVMKQVSGVDAFAEQAVLLAKNILKLHVRT